VGEKREWEILVTPEVRDWLGRQSPAHADRVAEALEVLAREGPSLGRDLVDRIKGSRYQNMKELRPTAPHLRVLFAFDKQRHAVMLVGGDKRGEWNRWYRRMVPVADRLLDRHHRNSGEVYVWQTKTRSVGPRYGGSSR
jgi:hypothetical protein